MMEINHHPEIVASSSPDSQPDSKPLCLYRCKKCRRVLASQENVVPHERGGKKGFVWGKKKAESSKVDEDQGDCTAIFVDPLQWMQPVVQDGYVGDKLQCAGCNARLGSFSWAGMRCNCGALVIPAFKLVKSRIDECHV